MQPSAVFELGEGEFSFEATITLTHGSGGEVKVESFFKIKLKKRSSLTNCSSAFEMFFSDAVFFISKNTNPICLM